MATCMDLMRHGRGEGPRGIYRGGGSDYSLGHLGTGQMERSAHRFGDSWQHIVSSPLCRCRTFANAWCSAHGLQMSLEPRLAERNLGQWEGLCAQQVWEADPDAVEAHYRNPGLHGPPGGEPIDRFEERVSAALADICAAHSGGHICVICHAGVIRLALGRIMGMAPEHWFDLRIDHAGVSRILMQPGRPLRAQVQFVNLHPGV